MGNVDDNAADEIKREDTATTVFDENEIEAIHKLRSLLVSENHGQDDDGDKGYYSSYLNNDAVLWRYLVAREFDIDKSKMMFVESIEWKKSIGLEQKRAEYAAQKKRWAMICRRTFYAGMLPTDKIKNSVGGPVTAEQLGIIDFRGLYHNKEEYNAALLGYSMYMEDLWQTLLLNEEYRDTKSKVLFVVNCKGVTSSILWYINTFKKFFAIGLSYFPEITYKIFLVNCPSAVTGLWSIISKLLPARTREKVQIHGSNFRDAVSSNLQQNNNNNNNGDGGQEKATAFSFMPDFLGGNVEYGVDVVPKPMKVKDAIEEVKQIIEKEEQK